METTKEKILHVAGDLFYRQGYAKTTTRQILHEAGILNGTLYHYYKNKEDIFRNIILNIFDEGALWAHRLSREDARPALQYALLINLEFFAIERNKRIAEFFYEAYRTWPIFESLVLRASENNRNLFQSLNPDFTDDDYYARTSIIKGAVYGYIAEKYNCGRITLDKTSSITMMALSLFNVPNDEINRVLGKSIDIVKKKKIVILGKRI